MNKVIFLDVDGVLNNGIWAIEMFDKGIRVYHDDLLYEPSLEQLRRIVDSTGAVIVVSSSWRQIPIAYLHLKEWLEKFGMEIYDKTPYVGRERGDDMFIRQASWITKRGIDSRTVPVFRHEFACPGRVVEAIWRSRPPACTRRS